MILIVFDYKYMVIYVIYVYLYKLTKSGTIAPISKIQSKLSAEMEIPTVTHIAVLLFAQLNIVISTVSL